MYKNEELEALTNKAKEKLKEQKQNVSEDIYGEFREEFEEIKNENLNQYVDERPVHNQEVIAKGQIESKDVKEEHVKLRYEMDEYEYEETTDIMEEAMIQNDEELLYPGGPTVSELNGWKKKYEGASVYASKILEEMFVFRTINRFEYKQLIRQANLDASQREEIICETTVLHPYDYNWKSMAKKEAGIPSTLSQIIMQKSGFTDEYYIEKL